MLKILALLSQHNTPIVSGRIHQCSALGYAKRESILTSMCADGLIACTRDTQHNAAKARAYVITAEGLSLAQYLAEYNAVFKELSFSARHIVV